MAAGSRDAVRKWTDGRKGVVTLNKVPRKSLNTSKNTGIPCYLKAHSFLRPMNHMLSKMECAI